MFLPCGISHGYTIRSDGVVRVLVVTSPAQTEGVDGWGGFVSDLESSGEPRTTPSSGAASPH